MIQSLPSFMFLIGLLFCSAVARAEEPASRGAVAEAMVQGNWAEALAFAKARLEGGGAVPEDLSDAVRCLGRLGREAEFDPLLQRTAKRYPKNAAMMLASAQAYFHAPHYGHEVAGEFRRGQQRGGQAVLNASEADRVKAINLALNAAIKSRDDKLASEACRLLAEALVQQRTGRYAWRLQILTDLQGDPEPTEGWGWAASASDPPVDAGGNPVLYEVPGKWNEAKSDGERMRWALSEAARRDPELKRSIELRYADFLREQFGVQTLAQIGFFARARDDGPTDNASALAVETLSDDETIARLATGVRRFTLPEGHRFIEVYKRHGEWDRLHRLWLDRRQRGKAAGALEKAIAAEKDEQRREGLQAEIDQIVNPWVRLEGVTTQPAGEGARLRIVHRNASSARFTARRVDVQKLLSDLQQQLSDPKREQNRRRVDVEWIGWRLVTELGKQYLGEQTASWQVDLENPEDHADSETSIATPLQEPGAYLVEVEVEGGNQTRVVVWVADTVISKKPMADGALYRVLDARSGAPIPGAKLELFGYRQVNRERNEQFNKPRIETHRIIERTDPEGVLVAQRLEGQEESPFQWMAIATTESGRMAHLGFNRVWRNSRDSDPPKRPRTFVLTDRPVYRPGHKVQIKAWIARPDYLEPADDQPSEFAHQAFRVDLYDARGDKVWSERLTADVYGGITADYQLSEEASLGRWRIDVVGFGGDGFRVEEYRKPEYEVTVEAPNEPTRLGDEFEAVVSAKYYYGSPVRQGVVKYRVTRSSKSDRWFPSGPWDWLYGRGYGWLGQDASWRSDWSRWGCYAPPPWWMPRPQGPPEVVAEGEAPLDENGELRLPIKTSFAKERWPDRDHEYTISAEVRDASRRTIAGQGRVIAARKPIDVTLWLDRGHYEVDDTVRATIATRRPDGVPMAATGELRLLKLEPPKDPGATDEVGRLPQEAETLVQSWKLATDTEGFAEMRIKASQPGRYRLVYRSETGEETGSEGGALFTIRGPGFDGAGFRFGAIEIVPDQPEYRPGDTARLMINTDRVGSTVALFVRPEQGVYERPQLIRLEGKSAIVDLPIAREDLPNFFVEAVTVADGKLHTATRQIAVPPETRVIGVEAAPSATVYKPGQQGAITVRLTDAEGAPLVGQATVAVYDRSVEAIAGGPSGGDIRKQFWDWKRSHRPWTRHNLTRGASPVALEGEVAMQNLGVFGHVRNRRGVDTFAAGRGGALADGAMLETAAAPMSFGVAFARAAAPGADKQAAAEAPAVRKNFADTALWVGSVETDENGLAEVPLTLPESLTAWKVRVWAMAGGARVGQGEAEAVTRKELMARLQTPRFLVEGDEATFSAVVNNESSEELVASVRLELEGGSLGEPSAPEQTVTLPAGGEALVEWRVEAQQEGEAIVRVLAEAGALSDAMQRKLPVLIHGAERVESFSAVILKEGRIATFELVVPKQRRPEATRLEVRYSPTLFGAMLDTLPYLIEYPHGCTEQTLNRFLPAVVVRKTLVDLGVDLSELKKEKAEVVNPPDQEKLSPVFDGKELSRIVKRGVRRLERMQVSDGGWGWFSGMGERSTPHTTAVVVRGLLIAKQSGAMVPDAVLGLGLDWLDRYREEQLRRLANTDAKGRAIDRDRPSKRFADNLDALVELTLADAGRFNRGMRDRLFADRLRLAPYSLATLGLALHLESQAGGEQAEEAGWLRDRVIRNLRQFVVQDKENQTAYLNLPGGYWWRWYGSEFEAHAYFLKLLAATDPEGELAPQLVKYLLANRRHAIHWNSTRDTALVVEAMADYVCASGEAASEGTVEVWLDGQRRDSRQYDAASALRFDGRFSLTGDELSSGRHTLELRKQGDGRLYVGASLTNFSLEDDLRAAGLEVRVKRKLQKLIPIEAESDTVDTSGRPLSQQVERYRRVDVPNLGQVQSGDLIEVELTLASKSDYEYLVIEDPKGAGFEPVEVRSGYNGNPLGAYVEYRDEQVRMYVRNLARGERTVRYRLRAETPGEFAALPTQVRAMYAPGLRGNSDEVRVRVNE